MGAPENGEPPAARLEAFEPPGADFVTVHEIPEELAPLVAMLKELPYEAACEVDRALFLRCNPEATPRERRIAELGALHGLLECSTEVDPQGLPVVERDLYEAARPDDAPRARRLIARYGSWKRAQRAARSMNADGRQLGPSLAWPGVRGPKGPRFAREECIASYRACALALGRRPTSNVYFGWLRERKRRAREVGSRGSARSPSGAVRLAVQSTIYRLFRSWPAFAAAAYPSVSEEELDAAWARRLGLVGSAEEPAGDLGEHGLDLAALGIDIDLQGLTRGSPDVLGLVLSEAARLSHHLGGSLDWLAGRVQEPGTRASAALRFDGGAYRSVRARFAIGEAAVRAELGWTLGELRRAITGRDEPSLGELITLAELFGVEAQRLCAEAGA